MIRTILFTFLLTAAAFGQQNPPLPEPWQNDWKAFGTELAPLVAEITPPVAPSSVFIPPGKFALKEVEWEGTFAGGSLATGVLSIFVDMPRVDLTIAGGVKIPLNLMIGFPFSFSNQWLNLTPGTTVRFRGTIDTDFVALITRFSNGSIEAAASLINVRPVAARPPVVSMTLQSQGQTAAASGVLNLITEQQGGAEVNFNASGSQAGSGSITTYEWRNNNTIIGTTPTFRARLLAASNEVSLKITNSSGLSTTATARVNVASAVPLPALLSQRPVVHGASFEDGTSWGQWLTIRGTNLSSTSRTWSSGDFNGNKLPTKLDGVEVKINGKSAFPYFVSPAQLNVLAPDDTLVGNTTLEVINGNGTARTTVNMRPATPGFFAFDPMNRMYPAAVHSDGAYVGPTDLFANAAPVRPAPPNTRISAFGSGFGGTRPGLPASDIVAAPAPLADLDSLRVFVVGAQATVEYAGRISSGLDQLNIIVPEVNPGDQPFEAQIGGQRTQPGMYLCVGAPAPVDLAVSSTTVNYTATAGAAPAPQSVEVTTVSGGPVAFTTRVAYSNGSNWLTVEPWGQTPQPIRLQVNAAGLAAGTYNATVTVRSCVARQPQTVNVRLTIN